MAVVGSETGMLHGADREDFAVMFTDVAGFTAMMERNEAEAMQVLSGIRTRLTPLLEENGGRLVKEMGDSTLSVFTTPSRAVRCAKDLQSALSETTFSIRVGIHWGPVLIEEGDVFGDTVNIASRLEQLSAPGGVCVSGEVLGNCSSGRKPSAVSLGLRRLKGLGRLVEVFALGGSSSKPLEIPSAEDAGPARIRTDRASAPAIAVTPFRNLGSPRDSFYAWSITSDLVSDLSRVGSIRIAPLRDCTRLWELEENTASLAGRLDVRYVVTGTLWRREGSFHLSIELVDAADGTISWSDNWEDAWRELPAIKGKLADSLLKAVGVESHRYPWITGAVPVAAKAYELYLQASHVYGRRKSRADVGRARKLLQQSLEKDPGLIAARILLSATYRDSGDYPASMGMLREALARVEITGDRGSLLRVLNGMGIVQWHTSELGDAQTTFRKVLRLAKSLGDLDGESRALNNLGLVEWDTGNYAAASVQFRRALAIADRVSDPGHKASVLCNMGLACWARGRNREALKYYDSSFRLLGEQENLAGQAHILRNMGSVHLVLGDITKAEEMAERSRSLCIDLGDRPGECKSLINLANVKQSCGLYEESLNVYPAALEIARTVGDRLRESIALLNLSISLLALDRLEEAERCLTRSLDISRETGDAQGECEALLMLGDLRLRSGLQQQARIFLTDAVRMMEEHDIRDRLAWARILLCHAIISSDPSPGGLHEAGEQMLRAEEELPKTGLGTPTVIWLFASACGKLATTVPADAPNYMEKQRKILAKGKRLLLKNAGMISDSSARESYLHHIPEHHALKSGTVY